MCSKQKIFLLILLIFRYPIDKNQREISIFESNFLNDFEFCPMCFENLSDFCKHFHLEYELDESITNDLNALLGLRQNRIFINKKTKNKVFVKYLKKTFDFKNFKIKSENELLDKLTANFFDETRLEGMQFCPKSKVKRFVNIFSKNYTELNIWMHMNVNIQSILLPYLHSLGFPVPHTFDTCGFTIIQSVDGVSLANLYNSDFITKLKITKELLIGSFKFSEGFEDFRIYITDFTKDNIVYNKFKNKVSFVDLDTVFIVDGDQNKQSIYKHEFIECFDCFAFSPKDMCASDNCDINVFAVCQLLYENLKKDRTKGFLYPIPDKFSNLENLLWECVHCKDTTCKNRFEIALKLLNSIDEIIKNSS